MSEQRHRTVVVAEAGQEVAVHVGNTADGRWFRLWSSLVDHGVIKKLSLAECRTLIVMAKFANRETWEAWPSIATIAQQAGLTIRPVEKAITRLEELGVLTKVQAGGGRGRSTVWQLSEPGRPRPKTPSHETVFSKTVFPETKNTVPRDGGTRRGTRRSSSSTANPAPATVAPADEHAAAGQDQVQEVERVLAVHKIGRTRRENLARQAAEAGVSSTRITEVLDATDGGPGLKIAKVEDLIDAAHAVRERAEAKVQTDAERIQAEAAEREAVAAEVLTGPDRAAALERGKKIIRDRLK